MSRKISESSAVDGMVVKIYFENCRVPDSKDMTSLKEHAQSLRKTEDLSPGEVVEVTGMVMEMAMEKRQFQLTLVEVSN